MWLSHSLAEAAAGSDAVGDRAVQVALIGGAVTVVVTLIGALVTLMRRDGNRTTASPPEPVQAIASVGDAGARALELVHALTRRHEELVGRVGGIDDRVGAIDDRVNSMLRHPTSRGPR